MVHHRYPSPIGDLYFTAQAGRLIGLSFRDPGAETLEEPHGLLKRDRQANDQLFDTVRSQLDAYFARKRKTFDLPIALSGTPFQLRVWAELRRIDFGTTISYRELAERIGKPGASRAVGSANGANPIAILVPCHRVIASDGSLAGFAGGVAVKRALLDHERAGAGQFALAFG